MEQESNPRKIIQISSTIDQDSIVTLYCLCNDASIWSTIVGTSSWRLFPDIPQVEIVNNE